MPRLGGETATGGAAGETKDDAPPPHDEPNKENGQQASSATGAVVEGAIAVEKKKKTKVVIIGSAVDPLQQQPQPLGGPKAPTKRRRGGGQPSMPRAPRSGQVRKHPMAFKRETMLLRLADMGGGGPNALHVWRVDSHQLLQKYERVTPADNSNYRRTNRYAGWECENGHEYLEVPVRVKSKEDNTIVVNYPTQIAIDEARRICEEIQKEVEDAMDDEEDAAEADDSSDAS